MARVESVARSPTAKSTPRKRKKPSEAINDPNTPAGVVSMPAELPKNAVDVLRQFLIDQGHNIVPSDIYFMQTPWTHKFHDAKVKKDATDAEYIHTETGQTVNVRAFRLPWMLGQQGGKNSQRLLVASGGPLPEAAILIRVRKGSSDFRIWRGVNDNPYEQPAIVKRAVVAKEIPNPPFQFGPPAPQISFKPYIAALASPRFNPYFTALTPPQTFEKAAEIVDDIAQAGNNVGDIANIDPQLWSTDSFESILEEAAKNASPFSSLASPDITFTETPSKKRKRGNLLDLTVTSDASILSLDNLGRGSDNVEAAINSPKPVARRLFDPPTTGAAPVSGNSVPALPTPVSNFRLSPLREDSPPTGTSQNIIFKFIGGTTKRERTLSQLSEFKMFLSHTTAAGIISEEDLLQLIKCSTVYPDGQAEDHVVVDAVDFLEMIGKALSKPGQWHLPDATCVITVHK
jgi:hypothetical protein